QPARYSQFSRSLELPILGACIRCKTTLSSWKDIGASSLKKVGVQFWKLLETNPGMEWKWRKCWKVCHPSPGETFGTRARLNYFTIAVVTLQCCGFRDSMKIWVLSRLRFTIIFFLRRTFCWHPLQGPILRPLSLEVVPA